MRDVGRWGEVSGLPEMLMVAQVARHLQVSARRVRERCASGEIRTVRLAGDGPWRIYPDGLSRMLGEKQPPKPKRACAYG